MKNPTRLYFVLFGVIFFATSMAHLVRFATERKDIWWTPHQLALSLAEARDRIEVYARGNDLQRLLEAGQLRVAAAGGEHVLTPSDVRVRLNNRDRVVAERVGALLSYAAGAGASGVTLLFGLLGWLPERRSGGIAALLRTRAGVRLKVNGVRLEALVISSEPGGSAEDRAAVSEGLDGFNLRVSGHATWRPVVLLARDPEGAVRGGLLGHVWGGWLHVTHLWVAEAWRGRGYGSALLGRAEEEARQAGASRAYLSTFSFQAPEFYRRLGYEPYATVEGFPEGHARYHMRKDLTAKPSTS